MARRNQRQVPGQLPMFMSAHEVSQQFQPLDADREQSGGSWNYHSGPGGLPHSAWTGATERSTHRDEPDIRVYKATYETHTRGGGPGVRTGGGGLYRQKEGWDPEEASQESDEELWERKAEEATQYGGESYASGGSTLYEQVESQGVHNPIHLGSQFGSQGKPQIVGGHHRIAVARETDPHRLMPVIHHQGGVLQAKEEGKAARRGEGGYKYH